MPSPEHTAKADRFHAMCDDLFEHYVQAISNDMDNYTRKTGKPMDFTFAHNDIARTLVRSDQLTQGVLAGMVAAAVLKEIGKKKRGGR